MTQCFPTMMLPRKNAHCRTSVSGPMMIYSARYADSNTVALLCTQTCGFTSSYSSFGSVGPYAAIKSWIFESASHGYVRPSKIAPASVYWRSYIAAIVTSSFLINLFFPESSSRLTPGFLN